MTKSEYIANNYCEQCSSQNIRSIFIRYSHKDSFSVREFRAQAFHSKVDSREITQKYSKGEQSLLNMTHRLDLIHVICLRSNIQISRKI